MTDEESNASNNAGEETASTDTLFEKTDKASARIEAANKKTEDLLNRQEELYAKQRLGGETAAEPKEEKKEETPKEYRDRIDKEIGEGKHND